MKSVLKAVASKVVPAIAKMTLAKGDINPRAVEFVIHYLVGNKKQMTLNTQEINATKRQWMREAMSNQCGGLDFEEGIVNAIHSDDCQDQWDGVEEPNEFHTTATYLSGITHGIVGGWNFTVDHENCVVKCYDVWDFNPTAFCLNINVPNYLRKIVESMLGKFNIPYAKYEMIEGCTQYMFEETKLNNLNERHAFLTEWEFSAEGMSCPLYYDQCKYDWMTPAQQDKTQRPDDATCKAWLEDMHNWF